MSNASAWSDEQDRSYASNYSNDNTPEEQNRHQKFFIEGIVTEIIDDTYKGNNKGETVGALKYKTDNSVETLAYPLISGLNIYPVINERVLIIQVDNVSYWLAPLNLRNKVNNNKDVDPSLNKVTNEKTVTTTAKKNNAWSGGPNSAKKMASNGINAIDKYFKPREYVIPPLKFNEGDTLFQGRFGNYINLSSNLKNNQPNIKITVKKDPDGYAKYNATDNFNVPSIEDLNTDNAIWITSDEELSFKPSSKISDVNNNTTKYNGQQIIVTSNRIIFNSKQADIIGMAGNNINFACNNLFSVDSDRINLFGKTQTTIKSNRIELKNSGKVHPIAKADVIIKLLSTLISILMVHTHMTPTGGPTIGPVMQASSLYDVINELETIKSNISFTE